MARQVHVHEGHQLDEAGIDASSRAGKLRRHVADQVAFKPFDGFAGGYLGVAKATHGKVIAHIAKANTPLVDGTGWHYHVAEFQIVYMLKGWARFMYGDKPTLVSAGDCVHQRPGLVHYLFDYSPDMEYLEIVGPANFGSVEAEGLGPVPPVTPWG